MKIPYWVTIAAVVVGILLTITNSCRFSDIPRSLVVTLLVLGIAAGASAIFVFVSRGSMGAGALLLIAASVIGLVQQKSLPGQPGKGSSGSSNYDA